MSWTLQHYSDVTRENDNVTKLTIQALSRTAFKMAFFVTLKFPGVKQTYQDDHAGVDGLQEPVAPGLHLGDV